MCRVLWSTPSKRIIALENPVVGENPSEMSFVEDNTMRVFKSPNTNKKGRMINRQLWWGRFFVVERRSGIPLSFHTHQTNKRMFSERKWSQTFLHTLNHYNNNGVSWISMMMLKMLFTLENPFSAWRNGDKSINVCMCESSTHVQSPIIRCLCRLKWLIEYKV